MVTIDAHISLSDIIKIAYGESVSLSEEAKRRINHSREVVTTAVNDGKVYYAITTGIGALVDKIIKPEQAEELQENIIKSHTAGIGPEMPTHIVRATMAIRAYMLSKGFSGISPKAVEQLILFLNKNITPIVPAFGSVGASGDLIPLAHIASALIGKGEVHVKGVRKPAYYAIKEAGLAPLKLSYKDGISLINGTSFSLAMSIISLDQIINAFNNLIVIQAMMMEALKASTTPLHSLIHELKKTPEQELIASNLRKLLAESKLSHETPNTQDSYSLRCIPQILGSHLYYINIAKKAIKEELESVSDNPLVKYPENLILSGCNFHGEKLAIALHLLSVAVAKTSSFIERQVNKLLNPHLNNGLPAFLIEDTGFNSGLMLIQYTAASVANRNKLLASPSILDNTPVSADQEDYISMSQSPAYNLLEMADNLNSLVAILLITAAQAIELRSKEEAINPIFSKLLPIIRKHIPFISKDTILSDMIKTAKKLIKEGTIFKEANTLTPTLTSITLD